MDGGKAYHELRCMHKGEGRAAYLCLSLRDNCLVVVKKVWARPASAREREETLREAAILRQLDHPHIIRYRDCFMAEGDWLCLVMDYADGGDLLQRIRAAPAPLPEAQVLDWFAQVCLALGYMHARKVVHRDVKCSNIFLTALNTVKLGDFGVSSTLGGTENFLRTFAGTYLYLSPEILARRPYNAKTDVWSLGVVLYELCARRPPFEAPRNDRRQLEQRIRAGVYEEIPEVYSPAVKELLRRMLTVEPERRPSIAEVLTMPVVQSRARLFAQEAEREPDSPPAAVGAFRRNTKLLSAEEALGRPAPEGNLLARLRRQAGSAEERGRPDRVPVAARDAEVAEQGRENRQQFFQKIELLKKELSGAPQAAPKLATECEGAALRDWRLEEEASAEEASLLEVRDGKERFAVLDQPAEMPHTSFVTDLDAQSRRNELKAIYAQVLGEEEPPPACPDTEEFLRRLCDSEQSVSDAEIACFMLARVLVD